jgi:predicted SnoaL-like aldol condensation-catalyzing enzyme
MSSAQENKAVSRRVAEEIFNGGKLDLADELYTPEYVLHDPSPRICTVPRA